MKKKFVLSCCKIICTILFNKKNPILLSVFFGASNVAMATDFYPMLDMAKFVYGLDTNSTYTLEEVAAQSSTTLNLFNYEQSTKTVTPVYYELLLKTTSYGEGANEKNTSIVLPINKSQIITTKYDTASPQLSVGDGMENTIVTGSFIDLTGSGNGKTIYNWGHTLGGINANFAGNNSVGNTGNMWGGTFFNYTGNVGDINANFVGNYTTGTSGVFGGVIANYNSRIKNISGNFIGNYVSSTGEIKGGAIYNTGTILDIKSNFISNYIDNAGATAAQGVAIYNAQNAQIRNIYGDFLGNYAKTDSAYSYGATIFNAGKIGELNGDFIGNYLSGAYGGFGGAIYNYQHSGENGTIGNITGNFINNFISNDNSWYAQGGAIHNVGQLQNITGDFLGNYAKSAYTSSGGAIYNSGTIGDIMGDFIENYALVVAGDWLTEGGAIYNSGTIGDISGDFVNNHAQSNNGNGSGGAIFNSGTIGDISGDFVNNYTSTATKQASGGAIYNTGTIGSITGDFANNYAEANDQFYAFGGAIYNGGTITSIVGNFTDNYSKTTKTANDDWLVQAGGGAIRNFDTSGNAINIKGNFIRNHVEIIATTSTTATVQAEGGAIYTGGKLNIFDSYFSNNYAKTTGGSSMPHAKGGAIYLALAAAEITLDDVIFEGNYVEKNSVITKNDN